MTYRIAVLIFIIAFSVSGCKLMEPFIAKPSVFFEKMALQDMSLFDATLLFTFSVNNPNPMGIVVQKGTYDFAIEGASMVSGTVDQQVRVKAGASEEIDLPVHVNFMDFFNSALALASRDEVAYTLSGSFDIMGFTIPYETGGNLTLPKFPEISVESVKIADFSLSGAKLNAVFAVSNPNNFEIGLDHLKYSLDVGGIPFLSGATKSMPAVGKNEHVQISVPVEVDFISMGRSAMQLLQKNSAFYSLSGDMRFSLPGGGTTDLPFSKDGEVGIRR